jgi:two-component system sporulation sensor kinase A
MTSHIAHEIKNPLTALKASFQLFQENPDNKDLQKRYFKITEPALVRIEKFIRDMLQYTRKMEFDIIPHNIIDIIDSVIELKQAELIKKRTKIGLKCELAEFTIPIDMERIKQVMINLIDNAKDAVGKNGKIEIEIRKLAGNCIINISDNGNGIPEDKLAKIFEPFVSFKQRGSGLGLPICKKIIQAHRGKIEVQSQVGQGTSVKIYLPRNWGTEV